MKKIRLTGTILLAGILLNGCTDTMNSSYAATETTTITQNTLESEYRNSKQETSQMPMLDKELLESLAKARNQLKD